MNVYRESMDRGKQGIERKKNEGRRQKRAVEYRIEFQEESVPWD